MGPFESNQEASQCICKRLQGNIIQFSEETIDLISRLSELIPREMISLASKIYHNAAINKMHHVEKDFFDDVFRKEFLSEVEESKTFCSKISSGDQNTLKGLAMIRKPCNPEELSAFMYPFLPEDAKSIVISGIQGTLERICRKTGICLKKDDCYEIINPIFAYALELALRTN